MVYNYYSIFCVCVCCVLLIIFTDKLWNVGLFSVCCYCCFGPQCGRCSLQASQPKGYFPGDL